MAHDAHYTSKELFKQLLDNIDDKVYFKDLNAHFILISKSLAEWHGFEHPEDAIGTSDMDRYKEADAQRMLADEQRIIQTGEPICGMQEKETWATNEVKWVSTTKMPLHDRDGNIIGTFGISRDITEQKLGEIKLHEYADRLAQINQQMEEDLHMAANLQQSFLPQFYPTFSKSSEPESVQFFHRYIASKQISGDLCAVHKLNDTEAGMLIFDVMGHGVRSALVTAIVHTMIGDLMQRNLSPGDFFSEMNRQLLPMFQTQDSFIFVTATYLVLNTKTGLLKVASAGHTTPFVIKRQTPLHTAPLLAVEQVNGPALAVFENFSYQTGEIQLDPGDAVLMYTDGILEDGNKENPEFGRERIQKTLHQQADNHPKTLCNALVDGICSACECSLLTDDICLLAFRWNNRPA